MCGGSLGSGGVGSSPFGSGSSLHVLSARARATNAVEVVFASPPAAADAATAWDALNPHNWTLELGSPFGLPVPLIQDVTREGSTTVVVYLDAEMGAPGEYRIVVAAGVRSAGGVEIPASLECRSALFGTFPPPRVDVVVDRGDSPADLANQQTGQTDSALGTLVVTDAGDYALERGRPYLKKRIIRRATTAAGEFYHLPQYGFGQGLKTTIRPGLLVSMAARARSQILLEPDVSACSVRAFTVADHPELVWLDIKVRDELGTSVEVVVPVGGVAPA